MREETQRIEGEKGIKDKHCVRPNKEVELEDEMLKRGTGET